MDTSLSNDNKNKRRTWDDWLSLYCDYKAEHGIEPSQKTVYCGQRLGMWCHDQRYAFRKGHLSPERTQKLADAGFAFVKRTRTWERWFKVYQAYKAEYGTEPIIDCIYQGQKLGWWCSSQRQAFHSGRLSEDQIKQLADSGFVFNAHDAAWSGWLALYRQYKNEFGYEPVRSTIYHGRKLGKWHEHQKQLLRSGQLSPERVNMLTSENFAQGPHYETWPVMFNLYLQYKQEHNGEPPARTIYHGKRLGQWCSEQRRNWLTGKLDQERIQALSDAGFYLSGREAAWDIWADLYCEYKRINGEEPNGNVVFRDKKLGRWCIAQRDSYQNGTLSEERIQKLNDAGFVWTRKWRRHAAT